MDPKTTLAVGGATGLVVSGILDQPTLLVWLGIGSLLGGASSLAIWEHKLAPGQVRTQAAILGQFLVGLAVGFLLTPALMMYLLPEGPWRAEHVAAVSFGLAFGAWKALKIAAPHIERGWRKRAKGLAERIGGQGDD